MNHHSGPGLHPPHQPLASVPWQHLGGGSRNKGLCLPSCLSLWALPDSTEHTWSPTGPLSSGPLTNPRTTRFPFSAPQTWCQTLFRTSRGKPPLDTSQRNPVTPACWLQLTLVSTSSRWTHGGPSVPVTGLSAHGTPRPKKIYHCLGGQKCRVQG